MSNVDLFLLLFSSVTTFKRALILYAQQKWRVVITKSSFSLQCYFSIASNGSVMVARSFKEKYQI